MIPYHTHGAIVICGVAGSGGGGGGGSNGGDDGGVTAFVSGDPAALFGGLLGLIRVLPPRLGQTFRTFPRGAHPCPGAPSRFGCVVRCGGVGSASMEPAKWKQRGKGKKKVVGQQFQELVSINNIERGPMYAHTHAVAWPGRCRCCTVHTRKPPFPASRTGCAALATTRHTYSNDNQINIFRHM